MTPRSTLPRPPELIADLDRLRQRALIVGVAGLALCGGRLVPRSRRSSIAPTWSAFCSGTASRSAAWRSPCCTSSPAAPGAWSSAAFSNRPRALFPVTLRASSFRCCSASIASTSGRTPRSSPPTRRCSTKPPYLNVRFFIGRAALYFVIWIALSYFFNKWSLEQDRTGPEPWSLKMQLLSGPGLLLYGATVTFSSIDWVMSLEPHWYLDHLRHPVHRRPGRVGALVRHRHGRAALARARRCRKSSPAGIFAISARCCSPSSCCGRISISRSSC